MVDQVKFDEPRLRDEVLRLRQENERLRSALREVKQLLELPIGPRSGPRRVQMVPSVGLL
jgi:hypothetical protein